MRELGDAIRLLAFRRHFADDWNAALALVGCATATDTPSPSPSVPEEETAADVVADLETFDEQFVHAARADGWTLAPDERVMAAVGTASHRDGASRTPVPARRRPRSPWTAPFVLSPDAASESPPPSYVSVPRPHIRRGTRVVELEDPDTRTRAFRLRALLRSPGPSNTVDVPRLIERIARREPLIDLPRRQQRRPRSQALLLVDTQLFLGPFASDVREVCTLVSRTLPARVTRVKGFRGDPVAGCGSGPIWTWEPFRPPATITTVLVVTGDDRGGVGSRRPALESLMSDMIRRGHNAHVLWFGAATVPSAPWLRNAWHVLQ